MVQNKSNRRKFLGACVVASQLDARSYGRIIGSNERVAMGVIGCGGRGRAVMGRLVKTDADIAILCDPDANQIEKAQALLPSAAKGEKDFRKVIDRKDLDAVLIATPDHWHALPFITAVHAEKDVYMEKPTAYTVAESRAMLNAAKKSKSIVQIGTQQRSGEHYRKAVELIQRGGIGKVSHARFWNVYNNTLKAGGGRGGSIGRPPDGPAPAGVDYDFWLGPAPLRPFNPNRFHWNYAYFWDYSGGMMSGWGVHHMDIIHWALGLRSPTTISAIGGTFALDDNRETPDTLDAFFEYPGLTVQGSIYHSNARKIEGKDYGIAFYGSKATLVITRDGYEFTTEGPDGETNSVPGSEQEETHARNFIDAVRSRKQPFADLETGHYSSLPCILANIAFRTGLKLKWDATAERFDHEHANRFLSREYRKPWVLPS